GEGAGGRVWVGEMGMPGPGGVVPARPPSMLKSIGLPTPAKRRCALAGAPAGKSTCGEVVASTKRWLARSSVNCAAGFTDTLSQCQVSGPDVPSELHAFSGL